MADKILSYIITIALCVAGAAYVQFQAGYEATNPYGLTIGVVIAVVITLLYEMRS